MGILSRILQRKTSECQSTADVKEGGESRSFISSNQQISDAKRLTALIASNNRYRRDDVRRVWATRIQPKQAVRVLNRVSSSRGSRL